MTDVRRVFLKLMGWMMVVTLIAGGASAADPEFKNEKYQVDGLPGALPYRIYVPQVAAGEKIPLLLCLHGAGERGDDNQVQLGHFSPLWSEENAKTYRAVIVLPQVPKNQIWATYGWSTNSVEMQTEPSQSMGLLKKLVDDLIKSQPIDTQRIYVTGLSMGGYGTWEFAQRYPQLVAAIAPVCGGGDPRRAESIKNIPTWAFHGDKDTAVKVTETTKMIDAMKAAGGAPKVTIYEGVGHNSWAPAFREKEFLKWMFEQRLKY